MKPAVLGIATILTLMVLLLGCTTHSQTNSFEFGAPFTAKEGITYISSEGGVHLGVSNFTDSRCPAGVQCIWAGERGADVTLSLIGDPGIILGKVHLGEITSKRADTNGDGWEYSIGLVFIDTDLNTITLNVQRNPLKTPSGGNEWFSIEPKKCNSNEWDVWETKKMKDIVASGGFPERPLNEADVVRDWLYLNQGIRVYDVALKQVADITCDACACSTGEKVAVLVDSNFTSKMVELGFTDMGLIACTMEAKLCPNGSGVGRVAPFCEFEACPDQNSGEGMSIVLTTGPGFALNPFNINKVATIFKDGAFTVETTIYSRSSDDKNFESRSGVISQTDYSELKTMVLSSDFFDINESDLRYCLMDAPSVELDINIGKRQNSVNGIYSGCDNNTYLESQEILKKINELIK